MKLIKFGGDNYLPLASINLIEIRLNNEQKWIVRLFFGLGEYDFITETFESKKEAEQRVAELSEL